MKNPNGNANLESHKFWTSTLAMLLPAVVATLLYFTTVNHGFVLDDNLVVTSNEHVQNGFAGIPDLFKYNYGHGHQGFNDGLYRPLSLVTFSLEKSFFNLSAPISHTIQALLYGFCVLLLSFWLNTLLNIPKSIVFWIALTFAVHPIHTEVVANLKSRDEILALLFFLASAYTYTRWLIDKKRSFFALSILLFFAALFSKESAVTFIVLFPLMAWYIGVEWKKMALSTLVLLVPVFIFLMVRAAVLNAVGPVDTGVTSLLQNSLIENDGIFTRLATASAIQGLYITKLFIPINLSHDYSFNAIPLLSISDITGIAWILINAVLLALGFYGLMKRKWWSFGVLFYYLTIAVVANLFILIGAMAAERFVFTPSLGWCIAIVLGLSLFVKSGKSSSMLFGSIAVTFAVLTLIRIPDWKSNFTLFTTDVATVPNSARAHYNAGSVYIEEAKTNPRLSGAYIKQAREHLKEAVKIWPDYQDSYNNLGISYMNSAEFDEAYAIFSDFIKRFPEYDKARYNMGITCKKLEKFDEAEIHFEKFLEKNKNHTNALYELADAEGNQGKFDEAIEHLKLLNRLDSKNDRGHTKLAMAYAISGNEQLAEEELKQALKINPRNADTHTNLGLIYLNTNRLKEAKESLETALSIEPNLERAQSLLAQITN